MHWTYIAILKAWLEENKQSVESYLWIGLHGLIFEILVLGKATKVISQIELKKTRVFELGVCIYLFLDGLQVTKINWLANLWFINFCPFSFVCDFVLYLIASDIMTLFWLILLGFSATI